MQRGCEQPLMDNTHEEEKSNHFTFSDNNIEFHILKSVY